MRTLKEPVIFVIDDTSFEVDVAHQLLRQTNAPHKVISFTRDMQDHGNHYLLIDDQKQGGRQDESNEIRIPQMTELDPAGMAAAYARPLDEIIGRSDFEVIVDAEQLSKRHQGLLPLIGIAGQSYIVDLRLKELRHLTDPDRTISLRRLDLSQTGDEYLFFYHTGNHAVVELDPKMTEFPDQVVLAKIPTEAGLDPVATAEAYGIDERQLLRRFPPANELKAQLVALADTGVPALISRNREALRKEHQQILAKHRPRPRQRL